MRTNPFNDAWLFLLGRTDDHVNSGIGLLLTILFTALLAASVWIARRNWVEDAAQRTWEHLATWVMRVMIGCMWFQGSLWKLPLPVSGGLKGWTENIGTNAAFDIHRWLAVNVLVPLLPLINPIVFLAEMGLAISFILGFAVRPMAVVGMLFVAHLWLGLYHHPAEWPWLYIFLIFVQGLFLMHQAGKSLGLDGLLARRPIGPFAGSGVLARLYRQVA